jgi:signal transduction histidine kinase
VLPGVILSLICQSVGATCFSDMSGTEAEFNRRLNLDPKPVIADLQSRIARAEAGGAADQSVAELYAMLMDALERDHRVEEARDAGARGLQALTPRDSDALRRRLVLMRILLLDDLGQINQATQQYDAASAAVPEDVPDYICVLVDRGYLHTRVGRQADAARELIKAYHMAESAHLDVQRADIGSVLARVYIRYGMWDDALAIANDALRVLARAMDTDKLALAHLIRGDALMYQGYLDRALAEYDLARSLYAQEKDVDDVVGADRRKCGALAAEPSRAAEATAQCRLSLQEAQDLGDAEYIRLSRGSLGEAELRQGHAREALDQLSQALDDRQGELTAFKRSALLAVRSQAERQLGDIAGALRDMEAYAAWLQADALARQPAQTALMRAKFDMESRDQALQQARTEEAAARAVAARRALLRNFVISVAAASLVLLIGIVWVVRRRRELIRERETEHERVTALGRLTAGIAHEFNNALTVVQQAVSLLGTRDSVIADPEALELVRSIEQVSRSSALTTAQLQRFGRQQTLRSRAVPLQKFLDDLRPQLQKAAGSGMRIELQSGDPSPCGWVDENQLANALFCLVMNARDAMSGHGTITICAEQADDDTVCIEVTDRGHGMTPEVPGHASEPFFTTKAVGEGAGLGLSMVDGFVKQSGGSLSIASSPEQGTTVTLRLPSAPRGA